MHPQDLHGLDSCLEPVSSPASKQEFRLQGHTRISPRTGPGKTGRTTSPELTGRSLRLRGVGSSDKAVSR